MIARDDGGRNMEGKFQLVAGFVRMCEIGCSLRLGIIRSMRIIHTMYRENGRIKFLTRNLENLRICCDDFFDLFISLSNRLDLRMSTLADELMNDLLSDEEEEVPEDLSTSSEVKVEETELEDVEMDQDLLAELIKGGIKQSEALELETVEGMDLKGVERVGKVIKLHGSKVLRETLAVSRYDASFRTRGCVLMEF